MPRWNKKVDEVIHAQIRDGLRDAGYIVFDVHALPGRLDLDVLARGGITVSLEVKKAGEPLKPREKAFLEGGWVAEVVHSLAEALLVMEKWNPIEASAAQFHLCPDGLTLFYQWSLALEKKDRGNSKMLKILYQNHRSDCKASEPCTPPRDLVR